MKGVIQKDEIQCRICNNETNDVASVASVVHDVARYEQLAGAGAPDRVEQYRRTLRQVNTNIMLISIINTSIMLITIITITIFR